MKKRINIIAGIIWIICFFPLAFGSAISFNTPLEISALISKNIYLNDKNLNKTIAIYKSELNIANYVFSSPCNPETKYIWKKDNLFFFEITVNNANCENSYFYLKDGETIIRNSELKLNLIKDTDIYSIGVDFDNDTLLKVYEKYKESSEKLSLYKNVETNNSFDEKLNFLINKRKYEEALYKKNIMLHIIEKRLEKYLIPVAWYNLPTRHDKIPNAARPYRQDYTDGIHHSWDIDTDFWETVIALDDALVVRIVNSWKWEELSKIKKETPISEYDLQRNLDILRGNQVWLKTMKWEIVMYAHLDTVFDNIQEGDIIKKGSPLGTIGVSGVPEQGYSDYHLDFSIHENPYNLEMAWKYDIDDYMRWPWKLKDKETSYILAHQNDFFESN